MTEIHGKRTRLALQRGISAALLGSIGLLAGISASAASPQTPVDALRACTQQDAVETLPPLLPLDPPIVNIIAPLPVDQCQGPQNTAALTNASARATRNAVDQMQNALLNGGGALLVFGVQPKGRFAHTEHDGFTTRINPTFRGPDFEEDEVTVLANVGIDLTKHLNMNPNRTWKVGVFAGYDNIEVDMGTTPFVQNTLGLASVGSGENDSFIVGGYSLMTWKNLYMLSILSGNWGETDVNNAVLASTGSYDTDGFASGTAIGAVLTLRPGGHGGMKDGPSGVNPIKLDVRAGYSYSHHEGDGFTDSVGFRTGDSEVEQLDGSFSATLFTEIPKGDAVWKPYVKGGVKHRFDYDNTIDLPAQTIANTAFNAQTIDFDDDDTFWNVEGGLVIARSRTKFNASVYYQGSDDVDTVGGRLGLTFQLGQRAAAPPESMK
ncbi:MAG: autotransporter outer membrane beta-barrel domain-containing protein [Methyloligellaceae bacterium]